MSLGRLGAWLGRALALVVATALVAACSTTVNVVVAVRTDGSGTVTLAVDFDQAAAARIPDLQAGLPTADLKQAGWVVTGPRPGPGGSEVVSAEHPFADNAELSTLMADLAGSGPAASRPFHLAVSTDDNLLRRDTSVTGSVDLRCRLACFDDPALKASVGQALGASPAQINRLLGADPSADLHFRFEVDLPGGVTSTDAPATTVPPDTGGERSGAVAGSGLVWLPALGQRTSISATSRVDNGAAVQAAVGVSIALVVLVVVLVAVLWRRRRRHFAAGGRRGRRGPRPVRLGRSRRSPFRRRTRARHGRKH